MKLKAIVLATSAILSGAVMAHDIGHEHEHVKNGWNAEAGFVSDVDVEAKLWSPRGKSQAEIDERAAYVEKFFDASRTEAERAEDKAIKARFKDAIVINSLMPSGIGIQGIKEDKFEEAVNKNRDNQISLISTSVWAFEGVNDVSFQDTLTRTDAAIKALDIVKVDNTEDIRQAKADGKMAIMYNSQGADFVIEDLDKVKWAKDSGIRVMNFTYNNDNALAGGGQNTADNGVTELGIEFIKRMNKEGVILDCSHSSSQTCIDMAKHSSKPVLATHSNAKALYDTGRNITDEAMKAIAATDGAVCTVGVGLFLNPEGTAEVEAIAEHVQYTAELIGRDRTCYASDYSHMYADFLKAFIGVVDKYPPEKGFGAPIQNASGGDIWGVARVLEDKYNWKEDDIRGFLGENLMRVYKANWK
ncbi:membrane dipeptidase [Thalassotalea nanhaiensis]|uniref:Membrane dipeptidase n=1 Tax=Thalassotalea nanhaiensis TaxID=3065648 RepID=A0ABY9TGL5_9GAMM|nr:membrane dipeptidase [Colwelliaceae bacterium SQ345]